MNNEQRTMNYELTKNGFSLTEVLLAVATLAIGMLFIAGTFLVGIHFSTIATERTIAAVAADEAFAKVKIYGVNVSSLSPNQQTPFTSIDPNEFAYPSTNTVAEKQYYWSALCRRVGSDPNRSVQVTVFVCRKVGSGTKYWVRNPDRTLSVGSPHPIPIPVKVSQVSPNELSIIDDLNDGIDERTFINDGYTIVDNQTGQIYRVVKRYAPPDDERMILLDRPWVGGATGLVWVVPPVGGGRYPCIAVYQKIMRF